MLNSNQQDFPVVDETGTLTGILSMTELRQAMANKELHSLLVAKDIALSGVMTVTMDDSLNTALKLMATADLRELPVVDKDNPGKVRTIISRKDIIRAYHEEIERIGKPRSAKPD